MFNLSGSEIVVILLLALVVLGPEKLPDALRRAGKTYAELKKMGNNFQSEMRNALDEPMNEMRDTAELLRKSAQLGAEDAAPAAPTTARSRAGEAAAAQLGPEGTPAVRDEDGTSP